MRVSGEEVCSGIERKGALERGLSINEPEESGQRTLVSWCYKSNFLGG